MKNLEGVQDLVQAPDQNQGQNPAQIQEKNTNEKNVNVAGMMRKLMK